MTNKISIRKCNTFRIFIYYIPSTFSTIFRNMTICYKAKNPLVEISNIIIIGLISLSKNFITNRFFPRSTVYRLVKNKFNGINNVFVKTFNIK